MRKRVSIMLFLAGAITVFCNLAYGAQPFSNETLRYVISYKWGLIHKDAGDATLTLRNSGDNYKVMLAAKTKPWADRVYKVRDTLTATIRRNGLVPLDYVKTTHEKGKYARDEVRYSRLGSKTIGHTKRFRPDGNGILGVHELELQASGPVYDMLSVFYYLRHIDYALLSRNKVYTATVFSGSKSEKITIRSLGVEKIKLKDKSAHEAYHIRFNFTQEGGRKSSDDIDTWISTDSRHIPLYLVGKLPVGEVRAYYMP